MNIGEKIKELRLARHLTMAELAHLLGVTVATANKYEAGVIKEIPYERLLAICKVFGVTPNDLLLEDNAAVKSSEEPDAPEDDYDDIPDEYKRFDWPYNLLEEVFSKAAAADIEAREEPADLYASVEYVLYSLPYPRRTAILRMRYEQKKTVVEIANSFGITKTRVGQIINKQKGVLLKSPWYEYLWFGMEKVSAMRAEEAWERALQTSREIEAAVLLPKEMPENAASWADGVPIEELKFDARTYNALKRSKINTVQDLLKYDYKTLIKVRDIGKSTYERIVETLESLGIPCEQLKPETAE